MKPTTLCELHRNTHLMQKRFPKGCWMFAFEWDPSKTRPRYNSLPVFIKLSANGLSYDIYDNDKIVDNISPYQSKARYVNSTYEGALTEYKQLASEAIKEREEYLKGFIVNQRKYLDSFTKKLEN